MVKEKIKKTKIVCTIGPASQDKEMLKKLIKAGMNVMRCNFSHGDYEEHAGKMDTLREVNKELGTDVAIMLDTKVLKSVLVLSKVDSLNSRKVRFQ